MLNFVMVIRDEGPRLDRTLRMLRDEMQPEDQVIAIDTGSSDRTLARLIDFSATAPCEILRLETSDVSLAEALLLALDSGKAAYLLPLNPGDHLYPEALSRLRKLLAAHAPDMAVINSGWWFADPSRALPRADAALAASLAQHPDPAQLLGLCPDPRRLVLARNLPVDLRALLAKGLRDVQPYVGLVSAAKTPLFCSDTVVLHPQCYKDPAPQLQALRTQMRTHPITQLLVWADDAVLQTAPAEGPLLCAQLHEVLQDVPGPDQQRVRAHPGPSGPLFAALHQGEMRDAVLAFALSALTVQHQHTERLASDFAHLLQSVERALPGPDYLRQLYDRARNL